MIWTCKPCGCTCTLSKFRRVCLLFCFFLFFFWSAYQLPVPASPRGPPRCRASDGSGSLSGWWGLQAAPPGPCGSAHSCGSPRPRAPPPSLACPGLMKVSKKTKSSDSLRIIKWVLCCMAAQAHTHTHKGACICVSKRRELQKSRLWYGLYKEAGRHNVVQVCFVS